jgi:hypothetical protein
MRLAPLIVRVEDTFGFSIPDEDAASLSTVGKLYDYVLEHRFHGKQSARLSRIAFHKIQRALMSAQESPRKDLPASMDLAMVARTHRRRLWRIMEKATGLRLPQLRRPAWVMAGAIVATFGLAIAVPMLLSLGPFNGAILLGFLAAVVGGRFLAWFTELLAFEFQSDCTTVGQLATATLARNYRAIVEEANTQTSDAEVWERLQIVVAEQLGVPPRYITKQTRCIPRTRVAA